MSRFTSLSQKFLPSLTGSARILTVFTDISFYIAEGGGPKKNSNPNRLL